MKNTKKILVIILILIILVCALGFLIFKFAKPTIKAVVVKASEKYLMVMSLEDNDLYSVSYSNNGNANFKQGQEVLIYYDGTIATSYPAEICHVENVKIIKENSSTQIPENILRRAYFSMNDISVSVYEFTKFGLSMIINDTNEYKYEYPTNYELTKKNSNGIFTEAPIISTDNFKTAHSTNVDSNTVLQSYNWENIYGELESGEYEFTAFGTEGSSLNIIINFVVDKDAGKITYEQPIVMIF